MAVTYRFDQERQIAYVETTDVLSTEDVIQYGMARMAATVIEVVRPIHVARNEAEAAAKLQEILAGDPLDE